MKRKAFIMAMVMCMMGSAVGTTGMTVYAEENTAESEESVETEESTESEEGTETEASVEKLETHLQKARFFFLHQKQSSLRAKA